MLCTSASLCPIWHSVNHKWWQGLHAAPVLSRAALHLAQPVQPMRCFLFASNFRMLHAF